MTVIARKWDKVKGCKYFLRNSWGADSGCGKYSDEYQKECHNGSIWMSAKRIYENGHEILYLPRKSSLPPAALLKEDPLVAHWIVAPFNQILVVDEQKKLKWRQFLGREHVLHWGEDVSLPKKFKWSQDGKWALLGPVGEVYKIFPGSVTGTLYLIDGNGKLHWYRWLGQEKDGKFYLADVPRHMGPDPIQLPKELLWNGWKRYSDFAAEKNGIIYAAEPQGRIYKYQHLGYQEGISWWKKRAQRQLAAVLPSNTRLLAVEDGKIYGLDSLNKVQYCAIKQGVCKHWTYAGITFELGEKPNWGVQDSILTGQYNFFSIDGDHNLILRVYAKDIKAAEPFRLLAPSVKISSSGWSLKERDEIIIDKK